MKMATRTVLVDDMDGGDADVTIAFVVDGDSYSIDLSHGNAHDFYEALAPFIAAAKKNTKISAVQGEIAAIEQRSAIREWAKKAGYDVSERGRIPIDILDAYQEQNPKGKKK
jgi:hypothetical protein